MNIFLDRVEFTVGHKTDNHYKKYIYFTVFL